MKKLSYALVATFIILLIVTNTVDLTAKNPPIGNPTPNYHIPIFNSMEDLVNWIETADAANYQGGRFENCLMYWRNHGGLVVPYFDDPDVKLVGISVIPFRSPSMMMIHFIHSTPIGQIIVRVTRVDHRYIAIYESQGIGAYYTATRRGEFEVARTSEKVITVDDPNASSPIERTVSYALIDLMDMDIPSQFTIFVVNGFELGLSYTNPAVLVYADSLIWHTAPIIDRSYEVLQVPPPSAEYQFRFADFVMGSYTYYINWTIPRTTDVAPFIAPAVNRTMIPLRAAAEALLVEVNWLPATQTVQLISQIPEPNTHYLQVGVPLPNNMGTAVIVNDRVFIPLAYAAQLLGARTSWDGRSQTASVARQVYWE